MIDITLQNLGLGAKEITLYKLILEYGKIAPAHLARLTKIQRTTIYSVAKELIQKGLILEDISGRSCYYSPIETTRLDSIIRDEARKLQEKSTLISELQQYIESLPKSKSFNIPKIKMINENDLSDYLHSAAMVWNESAQSIDKTWWGFQDISFVGKFEDWIDWFWKKSPKSTQVKLITNSAHIETRLAKNAYADRRQLKFTENNHITATQWVIGNYVIMLVTAQRPYYLIEINDSVLAHNMRETFKLLWEKLE